MTQTTNDSSDHIRTTIAVPLSAAGPVEILLVDGSAKDRQWARCELEQRQVCNVSEAGSAEEARNLILTRRRQNLTERIEDESGFNVIFLHNNLPDRSGLELLNQLRLEGDATPVVIVTDEGSESVAVEALRNGACDYIVKSGDWAKFFPDVVSHVIERDRMRRYYSQLEVEHVRFARMAAIGEMAAGIAHEIRNPMQVIGGMAILIRDEFDNLPPEEVRHCARAIAENCNHLQRVLNDVLREAQPVHGRAPLMLKDVVEETLEFMRFDLDFRHRAVVERDFETPGHTVGSRDQLKQVLINLLRNAAQAITISGRQTGSIRVSICEKGEEILLCIEDEGDGIPDGVLPRIFESGFSTKPRGTGADSPTERTTPVQGSGLGLHICRRLIESHAGRIWAESQSAPTFTKDRLSGALFCIALPKAADDLT